jgi:hypothetical protein
VAQAAEVPRQLRRQLIALGDRLPLVLPLVLLPHNKVGPYNPLRIATLYTNKIKMMTTLNKMHAICGFAHF